MIKKISLFLTFFTMLFLFSGCVQRELVISQPDIRQSQDNTWGSQTNVEDEENIDISDLDGNLTESETVITEEKPEQRMERITFPVEEYNRLSRAGKGTVKGAIYVQDAYGKRVPGSGTRLYLNPVTTYSDQWYKESYIGGYKMEKADPRLFNYLRFTAADSNGNFAFYGVPSGRYYLIGTVTCGTECGYDTPKNIRIATQVSVKGNQVVQKDLNRMIE
ncbi:carboxypeptidase regulatory-like domain-containing protein [Sulfurovum sp.]|uniref:carboxypeptidase regulatory-like domain-containing protein n=1 Tax=Sulfurovum sp. TaxID=1969726 RepID=UPI0025E470AE|nr:carboxypeptidase regulatory-like domain-containing protein [Sulfurovum sp.]